MGRQGKGQAEISGSKSNRDPPKKSIVAQNLELLPQKRTAEALASAKITLSHLRKSLGGRNCGLVGIQKAAIPIFGHGWGREVVIGVTAKWINNIIKRIKNSPEGPSCYTRLENLWLGSFINPADQFPDKWGTWGNILVKFGLFHPRPASTWIFLARDLAGKSLHEAFELAEFRRDQLEALQTTPEAFLPLVELWEVSRIAFARKEGLPFTRTLILGSTIRP